jgi:hypothetical protein
MSDKKFYSRVKKAKHTLAMLAIDFPHKKYPLFLEKNFGFRAPPFGPPVLV